MAKKQVSVDFGDKQILIDVPEHATVVEFKDPPLLPDPETAVRDALAHPHGSPPLSDLAKPGMRVAIAFDDPTRPAIPAQTILPAIVEILLNSGVKDRDILFIAGSSNHRKWTRSELATHLGSRIFDRFWAHDQIINHDCSDPDKLKFLGITEHGRFVEQNRLFVESDLMIYQGNVSATAWRSYTGTGAVIGLASTRSIASHHSLHGIPAPAADAGSSKTVRPRSVKDDMNSFIEEATGKKIFYVNAVGGVKGRLVGVFAGSSREIKGPAWALAESFSRYPAPQADVMIVGLPQNFLYGSSNNTLTAAVGAMIPPRYSPATPVLREGGVVIALSPSNGEIDPRQYPSYQAAIDLYAKYHNAAQLVDHEAEFEANPEYLFKYRHAYGYPALHPFWLIYEMDYTMARASAVIVAGTTNPAAFRSLGIKPTRNFDEAWQVATKIVGRDPVTLVLPTFWSRRLLKLDVQG